MFSNDFNVSICLNNARCVIFSGTFSLFSIYFLAYSIKYLVLLSFSSFDGSRI